MHAQAFVLETSSLQLCWCDGTQGRDTSRLLFLCLPVSLSLQHTHTHKQKAQLWKARHNKNVNMHKPLANRPLWRWAIAFWLHFGCFFFCERGISCGPPKPAHCKKPHHRRKPRTYTLHALPHPPCVAHPPVAERTLRLFERRFGALACARTNSFCAPREPARWQRLNHTLDMRRLPSVLAPWF